jgi:hypothetical protein
MLLMFLSQAQSLHMQISKIIIEESKRLTGKIPLLKVNQRKKKRSMKDDQDQDLGLDQDQYLIIEKLMRMSMIKERLKEEPQETTITLKDMMVDTAEVMIMEISMADLIKIDTVRAEEDEELHILIFQNLWPQEKSLSSIKRA